jgi:hypothetical protein
MFGIFLRGFVIVEFDESGRRGLLILRDSSHKFMLFQIIESTIRLPVKKFEHGSFHLGTLPVLFYPRA